MNNKTIAVVVVVIILIAAGGYYAYTNYSSPGNADEQNQQAGDVVKAQDTKVGTGVQASPNSVVSVLYIGKLSDGTVFDSSEAHGNEPLIFQLGTPGIIAGFQIGINGMKEGGERVIAIPASFGYGAEDVKDADGKVIIPANSTLVFEVKLLKVEQAPAAATSTPSAQ